MAFFFFLFELRIVLLCVCVCELIPKPPISPKLFRRAVKPLSERPSSTQGTQQFYFFPWIHPSRSPVSCSSLGSWVSGSQDQLHLDWISFFSPMLGWIHYLLLSCLFCFVGVYPPDSFSERVHVATSLEILPVWKGPKRSKGGEGEVEQGPGELEAQHHPKEAERKWQTGLLRIQVLCCGGHLNFKETGLGYILHRTVLAMKWPLRTVLDVTFGV